MPPDRLDVRRPLRVALDLLAQPADVLDACDSGFEREVGRRLLARGYRARPQVRVGGFRIDFVVEGEGDRRLAVELDGDRFHGPDRWADDLRRQEQPEGRHDEADAGGEPDAVDALGQR